MIFSKRHEQDLAEIKALNEELGERVNEALTRIHEIREGRRGDGSAVVRPRAGWVGGAAGQLDTGPLVAFVHIPKTAGSTLTALFVRAYSRAGVHDAGNIFKGGERTANKVASHRIASARVTIGHSPYAAMRQALPHDTRYVTFLREPVNRVLSHYYRHIHRRGNLTDDKRPVVTDSIKQAIVEQRLPHVTNLATRLLSSDPYPMGELPASALDEAKANLRDFTFVGITERSDESIAMMERALGLGLVPYGEHQRVTKKRPGVQEISDEDRALIAEANQLDAELYAFAKELFEESVAAAGDRLADDVAALRELNKAAIEGDKLAIEEAGEWLERVLPPGTTRPAKEMQAAAEAAGIPEIAFPTAYKRLDVRVEVDRQAKERVWTRPADARTTDPGSRRTPRQARARRAPLGR